jgi:trehalose 6-phosphate synthase
VIRSTRAGTAAWRKSPGGLVRALAPVLRENGGVWIGWPGVADATFERFVHDDIDNLPVHLEAQEIHDFYDGMCNRTFWPLYHDAVRTPLYHRHWWRAYVAVNRRFAEAAARVAGHAARVWIHDFHLQLVPGMLREQRPDLRIGFFLHIPFPPQELFAQLPWRREVLEGLVGADVVGFQTPRGARNFRGLCRRFRVGAIRSRSLIVGERRVQVAAFPISLDVEAFAALGDGPATAERAAEVRQLVGGRRIILGVDRLDYTKGIDTRLNAFAELLRTGRLDPAQWVFVQIAVPSRERVRAYRHQRSLVEQRVGEINGRYGEIGRPAVHYLFRSYSPEHLVAFYRAADILAVTPLTDGMNLVAKEFVATRTDNGGVLVLSEMSGAASELRSALLVNPHDIDGVAATIARAAGMDRAERTRRMRDLRRALQRNTVFDWSRSFLRALAE